MPDAGAGVRSVSLQVDGQAVDTVAAGGHCSDVDESNAHPYEYARVRPCPPTLEGALALRPEHLPTSNGHVASVVATDAAGQQTVLVAARVARAAPSGFRASDAGFINPDLNVTSASVNGIRGGPARMKLAFVVKRKDGTRARRRFLSRRSVRYGQRASFRGRVTTPTGQPIVGARVWRAVASKGGEWRLSGRPLITSRTGRVTGRTPVRGGSRRMQLVYFPYTHVNGHGTTPPRLLSVRATTTIGLDQAGYRNGDTARFSGRILSRPVVAQKSVHLQALVRGTWRTFDTTRANSKGRWALRYRFSATRRLTMYRFRAVIPAETQYPWATGHSRILRVLVAP